MSTGNGHAPRVLITGGAGFLGSHLADRLLNAGYQVRLLDNLDPQVHPQMDSTFQDRRPPAYLSPESELVVGSVLDERAVAQALEGVTVVVHFAAVVGVGQSHYQIARYSQVNLQGTAVLLEGLLQRQRQPGSGLSRLLVAGSMSVYGEGRYWCPRCGVSRASAGRSLAQLRRKQWEVLCGACGAELEPQPTDESKPPQLGSMYALTKHAQEQMCLLFGRTYGVPTVALRFFNAYGPRQALTNPYTGVAAVFAGELLAGRRPQVFEDGRQRRDLVSVHDVTTACQAAIERAGIDGETFNIASGETLTVAELAVELARALDVPLQPFITRHFRQGDARHCIADISAARARLGFAPRLRLADGMRELAAWLSQQSPRLPDPARRRPPAASGAQARAIQELRGFGLTG